MNRKFICWGMAFSLCLALCPHARGASETATDLQKLSRRALVSLGDTARLQHALAKARRGAPVTVAVIGGSITQGAKATKADRQYGSLVAAWWRRTFPDTFIEFVNAGIGATGSNYGALRAGRDLLSHHPDFVVVEFSVNDKNTKESADTMEGLLRQIMRQADRSAVIMLHMMHQGGDNAQAWHAQVGKHYGLPLVSYRDALWPEIKAGQIKWETFMADQVHPNDAGHAFAAQCVIQVLEAALKGLPPEAKLPEITPVPAPLFTDLFEHTALYEARDLKPEVNEGWKLIDKFNCWQTDKPGSKLEFRVEGSLIYGMHLIYRGPMGKARVKVDDRPPLVLDGWFDQTWGGYRALTVLARDLPPGSHRVRFEVLSEKDPDSTGHQFTVYGLGVAGVNVDKDAVLNIHQNVTQPGMKDLTKEIDYPTVYIGPGDPPIASKYKEVPFRPQPLFVPKNVRLLSLKKHVSASTNDSAIGEFSMVTDGDKEGIDGTFVELQPDVPWIKMEGVDESFTKSGRGKQWVQIDLEKSCDVYAINVWHSFYAFNVYHDVVVQCANDPTFKTGVKTLFNNDNDNSSGLGIGKDVEYRERHVGKLIDCRDANGKSAQARYFRFYSNGNLVDKTNRYTEIEIYGMEPTDGPQKTH